MKNLFISSLLVYIFSTCPGWQVAGLDKFFICFFLACLVAFGICQIENIVKSIIKGAL